MRRPLSHCAAHLYPPSVEVHLHTGSQQVPIVAGGAGAVDSRVATRGGGLDASTMQHASSRRRRHLERCTGAKGMGVTGCSGCPHYRQRVVVPSLQGPLSVVNSPMPEVYEKTRVPLDKRPLRWRVAQSSATANVVTPEVARLLAAASGGAGGRNPSELLPAILRPKSMRMSHRVAASEEGDGGGADGSGHSPQRPGTVRGVTVHVQSSPPDPATAPVAPATARVMLQHSGRQRSFRSSTTVGGDETMNSGREAVESRRRKSSVDADTRLLRDTLGHGQEVYVVHTPDLSDDTSSSSDDEPPMARVLASRRRMLTTDNVLSSSRRQLLAAARAQEEKLVGPLLNEAPKPAAGAPALRAAGIEGIKVSKEKTVKRRNVRSRRKAAREALEQVRNVRVGCVGAIPCYGVVWCGVACCAVQ